MVQCMHFLLQRVLDFGAAAQPHGFIFIDEAGFSLAKTRHRCLPPLVCKEFSTTMPP
uniref:Uncharacterized protein n=1 Tax=Anguilla anguilla TaxID=7936 RepID=A0A0E9PJE0_ANGAN